MAVRSARARTRIGLCASGPSAVIFCYVLPLLRQKEKVPHELPFCGVVAGPLGGVAEDIPLILRALVDPNESFFWSLFTLRPETDPRHSAHSLRAREGNEVKFIRPQRSGAAATRPYLSWISLVPPKR
ncbi:calmodulin-binding family protein [Striga asiatica]|uniref:Calmodulin-binding family protein n=1 Tax=Striga asiatica TaxID=4170 RepID=A0A5A7PZK8_STRAF|nr:calmodulin-binding family protein [Striga asiatica]